MPAIALILSFDAFEESVPFGKNSRKCRIFVHSSSAAHQLNQINAAAAEKVRVSEAIHIDFCQRGLVDVPSTGSIRNIAFMLSFPAASFAANLPVSLYARITIFDFP
ncbi:MAG: hypothetical protein RL189_3156 [Pseudomonadota bacterium]